MAESRRIHKANPWESEEICVVCWWVFLGMPTIPSNTKESFVPGGRSSLDIFKRGWLFQGWRPSRTSCLSNWCISWHEIQKWLPVTVGGGTSVFSAFGFCVTCVISVGKKLPRESRIAEHKWDKMNSPSGQISGVQAAVKGSFCGFHVWVSAVSCNPEMALPLLSQLPPPLRPASQANWDGSVFNSFNNSWISSFSLKPWVIFMTVISLIVVFVVFWEDEPITLVQINVWSVLCCVLVSFFLPL